MPGAGLLSGISCGCDQVMPLSSEKTKAWRAVAVGKSPIVCAPADEQSLSGT